MLNQKRHDKGFATSVQFLVTRNIEMQCEHLGKFIVFFVATNSWKFCHYTNNPLSLHNRKLSLHILCITAQYFKPCIEEYEEVVENLDELSDRVESEDAETESIQEPTSVDRRILTTHTGRPSLRSTNARLAGRQEESKPVVVTYPACKSIWTTL